MVLGWDSFILTMRNVNSGLVHTPAPLKSVLY